MNVLLVGQSGSSVDGIEALGALIVEAFPDAKLTQAPSVRKAIELLGRKDLSLELIVVDCATNTDPRELDSMLKRLNTRPCVVISDTPPKTQEPHIAIAREDLPWGLQKAVFALMES